MNKELWATVDYIDDVLTAGRHYTEDDLEAMATYVASLGVTHLQWILDTMWAFYDDASSGGFDVLKAASDAVHRHGMKFVVVFKPFEGVKAAANGLLPTGLPIPDAAPVLRERAGLIDAYRPFIGEHPEMNFARMTGESEDPGGRIGAIRLVKNDAAPSPFKLGDLSIWTSSRNGGYAKYAGPVDLSDAVDFRMLFPYEDVERRIVTLGGLELSDDADFLMIRREAGGAGFVNAVEDVVELVNENGEVIPSTPALRPVDGEKVFKRFAFQVEHGLSHFARTEAAKKIVADREGFLALYEGMRRFDAGWEDVSLEEGSEIVVMRGKERFRPGVLHPIYPEVRQHWLDHVRFCLERGVDAVNFRAANHNQVYQPRYFGFNDPVVERMEHPGNFGELGRINGDAYTQFLSEAAELLHSAGKKIGVHVHALMLWHADRSPNINMFPLNIEWQWETWLRDFADFVEYRGSFFLRPENQRQVADRIGLVARETGTSFVFQSLRGAPMHFDGPYPSLENEMSWVRRHPDVDAYNLYETANFTRIDPERGFQGSADIAELVRSHWA